jgi:hypothetical protein
MFLMCFNKISRSDEMHKLFFNRYLVTLVTQKAILKGKLEDEALKKVKWGISHLMCERNYEKSKIQALFFFINRFIHFADEKNYVIFEEEFLSVHENTQKNIGTEGFDKKKAAVFPYEKLPLTF